MINSSFSGMQLRFFLPNEEFVKHSLPEQIYLCFAPSPHPRGHCIGRVGWAGDLSAAGTAVMHLHKCHGQGDGVDTGLGWQRLMSQ